MVGLTSPMPPPADGYGQRGRHLPKEVSRLASDVSSLEVGANTNSRGGVGVATCGVKSKNTVQGRRLMPFVTVPSAKRSQLRRTL